MEKVRKLGFTVFFLGLLMASIPLFKNIPNILLVISIIAFVVERRKVTNYKKLIPVLIFIITTTILSFYKGFFLEDLSVILRLLIIPLIAIFFLDLNKKQLSFLLVSFNIGTFLSIMYSIVTISYLFFTNQSIDLSNGDLIYKVLLLDRPYIGFIVVIASIFIYYLYSLKVFNKYVAMVLVTTYLLFIFYISARLSILTLLLLIVLFLINNKKIKNLYKISFLILITTVSTLFYFNNDNIVNRFKLNQGFETFMDYEPRFVIWPCAFNYIKNSDNSNLLLGSTGFKSSTEELKKCYANTIENTSKKEWYLFKEYNVHNQYLMIVMVSGILGLLTFIYLLFSLYKNATDLTSIFLAFSLTIFFIFECVLYRQLGCFLAGIIIGFIIKKNED